MSQSKTCNSWNALPGPIRLRNQEMKSEMCRKQTNFTYTLNIKLGKQSKTMQAKGKIIDNIFKRATANNIIEFCQPNINSVGNVET